MRETYDAVVVGAGIVGAACAARLSAEGLRVLVVERDYPASGASGAAMGHVVMMDESPAQFALTRYSRALWDALAASLSAEVEYNRPGTLWLAADEDELNEVRRKHAQYAAAAVVTAVLDSDALADAEPNLRRPLASALLMPGDGVLSPTAATEYLMDCAARQTVKTILGKAVVSAERGHVRLNDGTRISIIATGAVTTSLLPHLPITKRKGHLILTESYPGYARHQLVELGYLKSAHSANTDSVAFNVQPRQSGQLLIGSSRQYGEEHPEVDTEVLHAVLQRADEYMPGINKLLKHRSWIAFRAATPDKLPLIGPTKDPTLFLAIGHEGLGITTSLATAHLVTDCLLGRTTAIPIEPYLPSRFAGWQAPE
jgi:D-hydroxyproline dehydrogenase subunit beta